jgi:hypothetical protein
MQALASECVKRKDDRGEHLLIQLDGRQAHLPAMGEKSCRDLQLFHVVFHEKE